MNKIKLFFILGMFVTLNISLFTFAQSEDNQLIDATNKNIEKSLQFTQFSSCKNIDEVLSKYIDIFKNQTPVYGGRGGMEETSAGMMNSDVKSVVAPQSPIEPGSISSTTDYSTTNLQKIGVDEPEIIKSDGKHIYYYNQNEQKIYVVKSPLDQKTSSINLKNAKIITAINIPDGFYGVQLFVQGNRLVIIGTKYDYAKRTSSILNRDTVTALAIYDIKDIAKIKLLKFVDIDGYYTDARMIGSKLYVVSQQGISWNYYTPYKTKASDFLPHALETVNKKTTTISPDCKQTSYLLPSEDTLKKYGLPPQFTLISVLDVTNISIPISLNVTMASAGQIHMSKKNLYLLQNMYFYSAWSCPPGAMCIMPRYSMGEQTLIHKFALDGFALSYKKSALVPGTLLTQYSMDEDTRGNFRILTQSWDTTSHTNFYALNPGLKLKGKIENIAPGENFKGSKYIGDKLYLVTFEQIDPLFVIDIANLAKPKIIGELKVPGYSTYLHPLGNTKGGVQYLIGLGYDTSINTRGGTINSGIKLSLFAVDYLQKDPKNPDYIKVTESSSVRLGGEGSWSEALDNPRLFVMDKKNVVTLPLLLQSKSKNGESCSIEYSATGAEVSKQCRPIDKWNLNFAGLKSFSFDASEGIKEVFSKNYNDLFVKAKGIAELQSWDISNTAMRVGYAGDSLYMFNAYFADFVLASSNQSQAIYFNEVLKK